MNSPFTSDLARIPSMIIRSPVFTRDNIPCIWLVSWLLLEDAIIAGLSLKAIVILKLMTVYSKSSLEYTLISVCFRRSSLASVGSILIDLGVQARDYRLARKGNSTIGY